jgi:hypothetical protein
MKKIQHYASLGLTALALAASSGIAMADNDSHSNANYCMDVVIEPFHMMPDGSCAVKDYLDGRLQDMFYPFTEEEHLFNCDYFGPLTPLPTGALVPSSVIGAISGTIDGHPFEADLRCASLTNWYQDSCTDPDDPSTCTFQLAQPFLAQGLPYPRVTEVSVFDGVVSVAKGKGKTEEIPLIMATHAAGIMHLEILDPVAPQVGASVTHSLLGLAAVEDEDDLEVMNGSADLLLQGHIFSPKTVEDDPGAAVIKGSICSKKLYQKLNPRRGRND